MKKLIPVIVLLLGIGVLIGAFFIVKGRNKTVDQNTDQPQEEIAPEVPLNKRPVVSLTPTADGHWLTLKIDKIQIDAPSLEYELLYNLPDGRTQGVPGSVKLTAEKSIERKLLLGSESSGKFRYDEGVEKGTITIKFRDSSGKLAAKFSTDFILSTNKKEMTSTDGKFKVTLDKVVPKSFFVLMDTFGTPGDTEFSDNDQVYGLFASADTKLSGTVKIDGANYITRWNGSSYVSEKEPNFFAAGIFLGSSK